MRNSHRGGPGAPVEKAKDFKGSIGKLARYMSEYKISLVFVARETSVVEEGVGIDA